MIDEVVASCSQRSAKKLKIVDRNRKAERTSWSFRFEDASTRVPLRGSSTAATSTAWPTKRAQTICRLFISSASSLAEVSRKVNSTNAATISRMPVPRRLSSRYPVSDRAVSRGEMSGSLSAALAQRRLPAASRRHHEPGYRTAPA